MEDIEQRLKIIEEKLSIKNDILNHVKLEKCTDYTSVTAIGKDGNTWYLFRIHNDGTYTRTSGISESSGFNIDANGCLKERK